MDHFNLAECLEWIDLTQPKYVCLYFLPQFYSEIGKIVTKLQQTKPNIQFMITISCSTGPDSLLARCQHDATFDAVIYFGNECLCSGNKSKGIPTFFVSMIPASSELDYVNSCLENIDLPKNVLIVSDNLHSLFLSPEYICKLKLNSTIHVSRFLKPDQKNWFFQSSKSNLFEYDNEYKHDFYPYKMKQNLSEYELVIFIGLIQDWNLMFNCQNLLFINPIKKNCEYIDGSKEFRKRVALIEKFKTETKESIGIVFYNFKDSVSNYIEKAKKLCQKIKKIPYFITLNQSDYESRLGNFAQLSGFVFISSCTCESTVYLAKYFYPIITWNEFLIASGENVIYGGIEWNEKTENSTEDNETNDNANTEDYFKGIIVERNLFHKPESWYGLVIDAGCTEITDIKPGRTGLASGYRNEQDLF